MNVSGDDFVHGKVRYIRGNGLAARVATDGSQTYYLSNGHGDIVELRDATGNTRLNQYAYDIWGNPTLATEQVTNPFRYSGEIWDNSTHLQYLRARWYDPSIGRFMNQDTYEGDITNPLSLNGYTYVHNNPLRYTDPSGHCIGSDAFCDYVNAYGNAFTEGVQNVQNIVQSVNESQFVHDVLDYPGEAVTVSAVKSVTQAVEEAPTVGAALKGAVGSAWGKVKGLFGKVDDAVEGTVNVAKIGDSFGKAGTLVENPGTKIDWSKVTSHGMERMDQRGVTKEMAESWVGNGKALSQNNGSKHLFFSREGAAVVANDGTLVTVIPKYDDAYKALSTSLFGK